MVRALLVVLALSLAAASVLSGARACDHGLAPSDNHTADNHTADNHTAAAAGPHEMSHHPVARRQGGGHGHERHSVAEHSAAEHSAAQHSANEPAPASPHDAHQGCIDGCDGGFGCDACIAIAAVTVDLAVAADVPPGRRFAVAADDRGRARLAADDPPPPRS